MQSSVQISEFTACTACAKSRVTQTCLQTTVPLGRAFRELYRQRASQKHNSELNSAVKSEQDLEIAVPQQHSSTPATSAQLPCAVNVTAQQPAAPTAHAVPHSCQGTSHQELGVQRGAPCVFLQEGASLLQETCFVTLEPKYISSSTALVWFTLRSGREQIWGHHTGTAYWQPSIRPNHSYTWRSSSPLFLGAANIWINKS